VSGPAARRVRVRADLALHVIEQGPSDGPSALLVHGLASNARLWDGVALELAATGHRVAAVDLRGHGRSDKPDDGYDMPTVAEDLRLLVDALGLDRPLVAGQSWGANLAVELAWAHPDAVTAIACVDGGTITLAERFDDFDACWAALAPPVTEGMALTAIDGYLRSNHPDWPETGIQGALGCFDIREDGTVAPHLTRDRHRLVLQGMWEHRPAARFPEITVPVLMMPAGPADERARAAKRRTVDEALELLPRASAHWFEGADHDVHAQHPVEVAGVLAAFLEEVT
jgi:pimeloyl-ACP methyl ester carboxylesterase